MALQNLWNDAEASKYKGYDELVYRANILGQDPSVTNWKGGNISGKYTEKDFDGADIQVLRVKGSGSDMKSCEGKDFTRLRLDDLLAALEREAMTDEEMVEYFESARLDNSCRRVRCSRLGLSMTRQSRGHATRRCWLIA